MDCRDIEDVSVLLPLSPGIPGCICSCAGAEARICVIVDWLAVPVRRSLLKLSTSRDGLVAPKSCFPDKIGRDGDAVLEWSILAVGDPSNVAKVFEKGFMGGPWVDWDPGAEVKEFLLVFWSNSSSSGPSSS